MAITQPDEHEEFKEDYKRIKKDVIKVVITNLIVLILLIGLYLANQKSGFLNQFNRFF